MASTTNNDGKVFGYFVELENVQIEWAKVHPHQREYKGYGKTTYEEQDGLYSCDLIIENETQREALEKGFITTKRDKRDPNREFVKLKRYQQKVLKDGTVKVNGPPALYYSAEPGDGGLTPLPETIEVGNGSRGNVKIFAKIYNDEGARPLVTPQLLGIQITKLIPYKPKRGFVDAAGNKSMFKPTEDAEVLEVDFTEDEETEGKEVL